MPRCHSLGWCVLNPISVYKCVFCLSLCLNNQICILIIHCPFPSPSPNLSELLSLPLLIWSSSLAKVIAVPVTRCHSPVLCKHSHTCLKYSPSACCSSAHSVTLLGSAAFCEQHSINTATLRWSWSCHSRGTALHIVEC